MTKSDSANYVYYDNVAAVQVAKIFKSEIVEHADHNSREYVNLKIIRSYKGELPESFTIAQGSYATCGHQFINGQIYLAFFDSRKVAMTLSVNKDIPYIETTLRNFTSSQLIRVDNQATADRIIAASKDARP